MRIFIRELMRRPGRFLPVGGALTMLVVLLVVLGGFLDGLELNQTGPYRAHEGRLLVFSQQSDLLIQRSRVDTKQADALAKADGVTKVGALNQIASTAEDPDGQIVDIVLFGYDLATDVLPAPPADGAAVIDSALANRNDVGVGDTLLLGATSEPVKVARIVDDLSQGSPTVWLSSKRWREVVGAANPASLLPAGVNQALVVQPSDAGLDQTRLTKLAAHLGDQEGLDVATPDEVVLALPVVQQQSSTFEGIIGVTFVVTLMVVALFFTLITLERVGLYAVLKALGARTRDLLAGISLQAVCVSVIAVTLGFALSVVFVNLLPATLPVRLVPNRMLQTGVGVLLSALLGSLFTLRRVLRIDPAEAIG
ncbi:MAG: ABC transporter permease [Candidatus Microthrix subdominans]|jgi:putative ABC transport system permease protein